MHPRCRLIEFNRLEFLDPADRRVQFVDELSAVVFINMSRVPRAVVILRQAPITQFFSGIVDFTVIQIRQNNRAVGGHLPVFIGAHSLPGSIRIFDLKLKQ